MRYLTVLLCSATLAGCATTHQSDASWWNKWSDKDQKTTEKAEVATNMSTLPEVDLSKDPGLVEQFHVGKFALGYWVRQTPGQLFQPVNVRHPDAAMVYFYRMDSRWNRQEVIAPNFFLNGERIPSLRSNHYYWMELPAGTYRLTTSRPLTVFHFQKPKVADFTVEAGKTYYLKYEEQEFRGSPDPALGLLKVGPFMQMPTKQGLDEIRATQLKTPGLSFVQYEDDVQNAFLSEDIHGEKYQEVKKDQISEKEVPLLTKPFKLWNPLTW